MESSIKQNQFPGPKNYYGTKRNDETIKDDPDPPVPVPNGNGRLGPIDESLIDPRLLLHDYRMKLDVAQEKLYVAEKERDALAKKQNNALITHSSYQALGRRHEQQILTINRNLILERKKVLELTREIAELKKNQRPQSQPADYERVVAECHALKVERDGLVQRRALMLNRMHEVAEAAEDLMIQARQFIADNTPM